ncbi:GH3 family domain-containing protein [Flavilitoribacter nigricans]|uniref:GH3 auxin-responsive promoter n=1 Tax=Flavilitoribacter nigricans (strain ATCC 23147 / DSM 23189 / NBRC 102662 / NCIMB 1420 / SS-2) TaxID=1122177 RepID=A0A2D0N5U1_FLAN2|nr:GH3 auxin-responsive promoter family protein [Flavilitoribacter nigricans]PHN03760.1 GH3 auxin-responsive promoter [Flavilitoribacter nigricans DSM 23189 = NBRC 102662]
MPKLGDLIKRNALLANRFQRKHLKPKTQQKRVLRRLLRRAAPTSFGQYYHFKKILHSDKFIAEFQRQVPLFDYDSMYNKWWDLTLNGVENVSWPGKIKYFALSSGTSGAPSKQIPVSEDAIRVMKKGAMRLFFTLPRFKAEIDLFTRGMLMLGGSTDLEIQNGHFQGDLSGINAGKLPLWLRPYYKPGTKISRIRNWNERIEEIAKNAPQWDVGIIVGIPAWLQLVMEKIIDYHQADTIHDIWPNLKMCIHGGVHFEPYRKGFAKLTARPLIYVDTYLASEGFFAFQARPDHPAMRLLTNHGIFYEFIPFTEENFDPDGQLIGQPRALPLSKVKEGVNYALVISSCSGAWRYLIGDTVQFTDKQNAEIIITGRTKHYLSICGEHLTVDNMNQGIQTVEKQLDISIPEYTVAAVHHGNFYAHQWYIGSDRPIGAEKIRAVLDASLQTVNADYATERTSVLREVFVQVLPVAYFYQFLARHGKLGGQHKFPRVLKKDQYREWCDFVEEQKTSRNPGHRPRIT